MQDTKIFLHQFNKYNVVKICAKKLRSHRKTTIKYNINRPEVLFEIMKKFFFNNAPGYFLCPNYRSVKLVQGIISSNQ